MTIKSLFGFSVTPENLTPTPVLIYICITVVSVPFLLVVIVTCKCKQKKNRGSKHENKTAERNSTEALSSGETENDNKHSEVRKAQSQKDEGHEKQEVEKKMKAETLKANESEGNESQDVKAEVRIVEDQNEGNENLQTPNKDLKTDNAELQLSKSDEVLKKTKPEPEKQSVEISTPKEELEKNEEMTPDMLKKKQKTSSLKLALAVTRINKLEDTVDQFFSGKNQSMENELDNLKRTLQAKEKELETFKWLRNYLINEIPESFSQLKFELAISRVQKLEDKVEELLHGKDQSNEKDLQILKWKLEAKEEEAAALKLSDEHQTEEGDEKNLQTLENNSPNHVVDEEVAVAQQQLQGEEQHRADDELEKNEEMTPDMLKKKQKTSSLKLALAVTRINKLEDTVDQFFSGKNQSMETELDNLKRTLQAKEKELETFKWLRNYLINEIPESFSQLKFELAISRVQKLEDKVEELLHGKDQSNEKDLQILKWKLEAKEKEAAALKLSDEHQTEEGDEKNLQTLENNSPNHVVDEEVTVAQQQLQGEEQHRADDELDKTEVMTPDTLKEKQEASSQLNLGLAVTTRNKIHQPSADHEDTSQTIDELKQTQNLLEEKNAEIRMMWKQFKNTLNEEKQRNKEDLNSLKKELEAQNKKLEIKVSEVQQQLKDEQQSREEAEKDVQTLKDELENKNKELQESKCQFESLTEVSQKSERQLSELKERYKEEFKKKIRAEKQRRKEVEEDVKSLKQELENKINQLQKAKEDPEEAVKECDISGDEHLVPTEPTNAPDN